MRWYPDHSDIERMNSPHEKNKIAISIMLAAFLLASIIFCFFESESVAEIHGVSSSELSLNIIQDEGIRREEYVDAEGNVSFATDKHYAVVVKRLNEDGYVIAENYYDENDNLVTLQYGQSGVLREYNQQGYESKITYVDASGKPLMISLGYASRVKDYDEDGRCIRITNLDIEGQPVNSSASYAIEQRTFDAENHIKTVMYYDADGEPTVGLLGQYGEAYEYDKSGRRYKTAYLNQRGIIMTNIDGYAILEIVFREDNTVKAEMYFDISGDPVKLSHGEYGIQRENGRRMYLNKDGSVNHFLSLNELLHANMLLAIIIGFAICMLTVVLPKPFKIVVLLLYVFFIIYMTLLYREGGTPIGQFEVLWSYKEFFRDRSLRVELFQNIWLFIPFGSLLYFVFQRRCMMIVPLLFSIVIETFQYYTGRGLFEFDDMISNGLGGVLGFWFGELAAEAKSYMKMHFSKKTIEMETAK